MNVGCRRVCTPARDNVNTTSSIYDYYYEIRCIASMRKLHSKYSGISNGKPNSIFHLNTCNNNNNISRPAHHNILFDKTEQFHRIHLLRSGSHNRIRGLR